MITLNYLVRKKRVPLVHGRIKGIVNRVLKSESLPAGKAGKKGKLGIVFVSDKEIRILNQIYFKKDRATDVIAFPMQEDKLLGDVVISVDTAERNARRFKVSVKEELIRLVVHGILHLLGYHDRNIKRKEELYFQKFRSLRLNVAAPIARNREVHSQVARTKGLRSCRAN